jgi:hypothetical protein
VTPKVHAFVPTVRPELLRKLLRSWRDMHAFHGWWPADTLHVHAQREPRSVWAPLMEEFFTLPLQWTMSDSGGPVFPMRVQVMLAHPEVDVWINLDDDMELVLGKTDFGPAIKLAMEPGVGVVSCGWVRSEHSGLLKRYGWPVAPDDLWVKQPIVNMAGGMVYARKVVEKLVPLAGTPYLFDDVQVGLTAYLAGYENYRYRGSLLIHRILAPGGLKTAFNEDRHVLPDPAYVRTKRCRDEFAIGEHNIYMVSSSDLTPLARETHRKNRALLPVIATGET